jgi:DNA/RNA non-specific endonuclease
MSASIRGIVTELRWLGILALPLALFACGQQPTSPPENTARLEFNITPAPENASDDPQIAPLELMLRDNNPDNDGYARLAISMGGVEGLIAFMEANAANPEVIEEKFERFGVGFTGYEPPRRAADEVLPLAVSACVRLFPASDRNKTLTLPNGYQNVAIDNLGRPTKSSLSWPPMRISARDPACQSQVGNEFTGASIPDQDGGHIVGSALGGYGRRANLAPQNRNFNTGVWAATELAFRSCRLKPTVYTGSVKYPIPANINTPEIRPTEFRAEGFISFIDIDGKPAQAQVAATYLNQPQGGPLGPQVLAGLWALLRRVGCGLTLNVTPVTPYDGSNQLCPRVKGSVNYEFVDVGGNFSFSFLIDGVASPYFDLVDTGSSIDFALTRSCNLSVGTHQMSVKVVDTNDATGQTFWTSNPMPFEVQSNGWRGYVANDTDNCPGLPGLPMDLSARADGVPEQRQNAVQPGGALSILYKAGLTYTLEGIYTGTTVGSSDTYELPAPFDGDPVTVNGRTAYGIMSFRQGCPDPTLLRASSQANQPLARVTLPAFTKPVVPKTLSVRVP